MIPCIDNQIPVYIRNIFNRDFKGTVITGRSATLQDADAAIKMRTSGACAREERGDGGKMEGGGEES